MTIGDFSALNRFFFCYCFFSVRGKLSGCDVISIFNGREKKPHTNSRDFLSLSICLLRLILYLSIYPGLWISKRPMNKRCDTFRFLTSIVWLMRIQCRTNEKQQQQNIKISHTHICYSFNSKKELKLVHGGDLQKYDVVLFKTTSYSTMVRWARGSKSVTVIEKRMTE